MMSVFSCLLAHICLLLKSVCLYPLPTFERVCFFSCKSALVLHRFWILALCLMGRLQNFFAILLVASLMIVSFAVQKLLSLLRSYLSILAFVAIAFGVLAMKSLPMPMS